MNLIKLNRFGHYLNRNKYTINVNIYIPYQGM